MRDTISQLERRFKSERLLDNYLIKEELVKADMAVFFANDGFNYLTHMNSLLHSVPLQTVSGQSTLLQYEWVQWSKSFNFHRIICFRKNKRRYFGLSWIRIQKRYCDYEMSPFRYREEKFLLRFELLTTVVQLKLATKKPIIYSNSNNYSI